MKIRTHRRIIMDVVPVEPGTENKWEKEPFSGSSANGFIWGRGSIDNKSTVVGTLEAVEILLADLSWEDTVNVPAKASVCIAWLPDERPGEWMYHCHILEQHAGGMMAHFQIVN